MKSSVALPATCFAAYLATGCTAMPPDAITDTAAPVVAAPSDAPAAARADAIPPRFHGEWNRVLSDCGTGRNDSRLTLSADRVRFYESSGQVTSVTRYGADEIGITVEMAGEGERWTAQYRFRLSPDGRSFIDVGNDAGPTRYRCG